MDILFWIQSNPKILIDHTTKKYFNKYLYKLVVYAPAGRLIDSKDEIAPALQHRKDVSKSINYGGYWGNRHNKDLDQANVEFLTVLRDIRRDDKLNVKLRVEEPRVQIYAETNEELVALFNSHLKPFADLVEVYAGPASNKIADVLNTGAIIRKTDIGFSHKVILRDGRYTPELKRTLLTYLENLGPNTIKLPKSCCQMLSKSNGFIWNLYFYTNDPSILTFVTLMHPGIVSNIHELVVEHQ